MFGMRLGFEQPIYLVLLAFLPFLWWIGYQPLRALGHGSPVDRSQFKKFTLAVGCARTGGSAVGMDE